MKALLKSKMTVMLESGVNISPVITPRFPYWEFEKRFEVMTSGQAGKVILDWRVAGSACRWPKSHDIGECDRFPLVCFAAAARTRRPNLLVGSGDLPQKPAVE